MEVGTFFYAPSQVDKFRLLEVIECMLDANGGIPFVIACAFLTTRHLTSLGHNVPTVGHDEVGEGGHKCLRQDVSLHQPLYHSTARVIRGELISTPMFFLNVSHF